MGRSRGKERVATRSRWTHAVAAGMVAVFVGGCAPKQWVPLDLGPGAVDLYVDGRRVDGVPREVELRADRDHKLFVKRPGYLPELVVLEAREVEGDAVLRPPSVRVWLEPVIGDRSIEIEEAPARPVPQQP